MKKTKKIVALVIALVMMLAVSVTVLAACKDKDDDLGFDGGTFDITVWVSETAGVKEMFAEQIKKFNDSQDKYTFNATVEGVSESESATQVITDVASAPDLYGFAQDQTARLVQAGALSQPGKDATKQVQESNDPGSVKAATVGGQVRAYPMTSDNGYFMMYDKRVIKESSLGDLAAIIADCEAAGKNFSMEIETSAWYTASFFFGTGCVSEWQVDEDGKATGITDTFNSEAGIAAMKGMQIVTKSANFVSSSSASDFAAATPSAVVVTGTWDVNTAKEALGDNLGMVELPSFTVDGQTYHMGSYSGYKLLGVKPTTDANKAAGLSLLARYLTNEENQLERFEAFNWGPSNLDAQKDEAVLADEGLTALAAQSAYATPQGVIDGSWWDIAKLLGVASREATSENDLQQALDDYDAKIEAALNKSDDELRAWAVIGDIGGTSWDTDLKMVEDPENTWITEKAYEITAGTAFKIRQGGSWDNQFGAGDAFKDGGSANITLESLGAEAGTYYIKLVLTVDADGNITGGTVSLVAA